jgi:ribose-phosphate pyrophosphokinase
MSGYMIFSGTSNPELSQEIATYLEMPLSDAKINRPIALSWNFSL